MKRILPLLALLIPLMIFSQEPYVKIDSLGYHLGDGSGAIIEVPNKSSAEIYTGILDYINKTYENPDKVIKAKTENSYIRFEFVDYNMAFLKRGLGKINIGGKTGVEIDFKDGKIRVKELYPELYVLADDITNRKPFLITGGMLVNSLYNKKLRPKKEMVNNEVKEQLEGYYNTFISKIVSSFDDNKDDW